MAYIPTQQINVGSFIPTTNVWDVADIQKIDVNSSEFKELIVRLYQNINNIALSLNTRDAGLYVEEEFVNGQVFFTPDSSNINETRQCFRKVIDFGQLPNAGAKAVNHGIDNALPAAPFIFTRIYGAATDTTARTSIPIDYASPVLANNIQLDVTATQVIVTTGSNRTNYDTCYIVLEYLKF